MTAVRWTDETPEIDAAAAAGAMKFAVEYFIRQMRYGAIRGRVERGTGEDDGLYRLILQHADREVPMIVGRDGATISHEQTMNVPAPVEAARLRVNGQSRRIEGLRD